MMDEYRLVDDGVDILVSTHKRIFNLLDRKRMYLSNLKWLVIDEADTISDSGYLDKVLERFSATMARKQ